MPTRGCSALVLGLCGVTVAALLAASVAGYFAHRFYVAEARFAQNIDFYVVEIPTRTSRTEFRSTVERLPPETRERLKIISPLAAFARAARPDLKLYYEQGHGHLTPTGVRTADGRGSGGD